MSFSVLQFNRNFTITKASHVGPLKKENMKLSELKSHLGSIEKLVFELPDGGLVPQHFHVTEVGQITKNFIDCGGTVRSELTVNFQLWEAEDFDHRLAPQKLKDIIALSERVLGLQDAEIEVEYQQETIGKFGLDFKGGHFVLTSKTTACLAEDQCGVGEKKKLTMADLASPANTCKPGSGCC